MGKLVPPKCFDRIRHDLLMKAIMLPQAYKQGVYICLKAGQEVTPMFLVSTLIIMIIKLWRGGREAINARFSPPLQDYHYCIFYPMGFRLFAVNVV